MLLHLLLPLLCLVAYVAASEVQSTFVPVHEIADQLLMTAGIDADSSIQVFDSSEAFLEAGAAIDLSSPTVGNTTVFGSVVVIGSGSGSSSSSRGGGGSKSASSRGAVGSSSGGGPTPTTINDSSSHSSPGTDAPGDSRPQVQTQIYYNCTSAPNIWDYRQDANIDTATFFEVTVLNATESNTTVQARFALHDCDLLRNYSTTQIVAGNAFFGDAVAAASLHFRVQESDVEELSRAKSANNNGASDARNGAEQQQLSDSSSSEAPVQPGCIVTVLLVRATVEELYPECDIKFKSNDVRSLFPNRRFGRGTRRVGSESGDATGETSAKPEALKSSIDVFIKDPLCDLECGVAGTTQIDKYSAGSPGIDRCYDCASEYSPEACPSTFPYTAEKACCRQLACTASTAPIGNPDEDVMTWNLADDGVTILEPEYVFHQRGDCSDPTSLSSDCCRITCRNCFLELDMDSIEFHYSVLKFTASGEAAMNGRGSLTLAVFAPNGCLLSDSLDEIKLPFNGISITHWGFTVGISLELFRHNQLYIKTHNSEVVLGANFVVQDFAGGFENTKTYTSGSVVHTTTKNPKPASLDIKLQTGIVFKVMVSLSFLKGLAAIRVGLQSEVFMKVEASVSTPQLFPALATSNYKSSLVTTGDCRAPHFLRYNVAGGFEDTRIVYGYTLLYRDSKDYYVYLPAVRYEKSYRSGCISPAYTARFMLAVQRSVVQALLDDDVRQGRLLRALTQGLLFPDLDPNAMRVAAISTDNGTVEVEISVPPSIADDFATSALFMNETRVRARLPFFQTYVSAEAGVPVNSVCPQGFWGTKCDKECSPAGCGTNTRCVAPTCDAVTGETYACGACAANETWGDTCDIDCLPPDACSNATCTKSNGTTLACSACNDGYWDNMCNGTCSIPSCVLPQCNKMTGEAIRCTKCHQGFWGKFCNESGITSYGRPRPKLVGMTALLVLFLLLQVLVL